MPVAVGVIWGMLVGLVAGVLLNTWVLAVRQNLTVGSAALMFVKLTALPGLCIAAGAGAAVFYPSMDRAWYIVSCGGVAIASVLFAAALWALYAGRQAAQVAQASARSARKKSVAGQKRK
jgi:hypothetical protein